MRHIESWEVKPWQLRAARAMVRWSLVDVANMLLFTDRWAVRRAETDWVGGSRELAARMAELYTGSGIVFLRHGVTLDELGMTTIGAYPLNGWTP